MFESNVFLDPVGIFKPLFFSLHNRRAVGKIVGSKTYDFTVGELKKFGKFKKIMAC